MCSNCGTHYEGPFDDEDADTLEDALGTDLLQATLEMVSRNYPSPLLAKRKRLDCSFEELDDIR